MNLTLSAVLVTLAFVVVAYADPIPRAVAEAKPDPDPEADPNAFLRRRVVNVAPVVIHETQPTCNRPPSGCGNSGCNNPQCCNNDGHGCGCNNHGSSNCGYDYHGHW